MGEVYAGATGDIAERPGHEALAWHRTLDTGPGEAVAVGCSAAAAIRRGVGVRIGFCVSVGVPVGVSVSVAIDVGVRIGVRIGVGIGVRVRVAVAIGGDRV